MLPQNATEARTKTTKIGHTQKLVMFCSKLFAEFWWLNMQNWFYHLNLTQSLLVASLPPAQSFLSISTERKEWKIVKKRRKKFEEQKKKSRAIKCRLFRLPLTNCCYSNERLQHSPRKKQKLMIIIRFFSVCLCRANINFVHVNVSVHKWNYIWLGASSISHTKNFNSR